MVPVSSRYKSFFGGGTPSLLPIAGLEKLLSTLAQQWGLAPDVEISLEIDPGTFTATQLRQYQSLGVNRFSLGVQAFQDSLLETCGRTHRYRDIEQALMAIAQVGIKNWSLDLISGLPGQTKKDWQTSLTMAIAAQPAHLSCYDLVLEPQTVFERQQQQGRLILPVEELSAHFFRQAQQTLTTAGFDHYEISNYALPGYRCRHNQVYWRNQPYYGFGMGATSYLQHRRFSRPRTRADYYQWLQTWLATAKKSPGAAATTIDQLLESLMLGLRLTRGITWAQLPAITTRQKTTILNTIAAYIDQQWAIAWDNQQRILTAEQLTPEQVQGFRLSDPDGLLYSNQILSDLFAALSPESD